MRQDQAGGRAITSIAEKIGCAAETLRSWVRQAERDGGRRPGLKTDERARFRRPSSRRPTMTDRPLQSAWRFSRNELSGKPGTVQSDS